MSPHIFEKLCPFKKCIFDSEVFKIYDLRENDNRCSNTKETISSYIMMNTSTIRCPKPKYDNGCQYFCSWQVGLGNEY